MFKTELEATMKISHKTRELLKHFCRKDQTYDQYIAELIKFKQEHEDHD